MTQEFIKARDDIQASFNLINPIYEETINELTSEIDTIMSKVRGMLDADYLDTNELESYYLNLAYLASVLSVKIENVGLQNDISESVRKSVYNQTYLNSQVKDNQSKNKTTVAECQSLAESASMQESVITNIYERVYKALKLKYDAVSQMILCIGKVLNRRIQDENYTPGKRKVLNENY